MKRSYFIDVGQPAGKSRESSGKYGLKQLSEEGLDICPNRDRPLTIYVVLLNCMEVVHGVQNQSNPRTPN